MIRHFVFELCTFFFYFSNYRLTYLILYLITERLSLLIHWFSISICINKLFLQRNHWDVQLLKLLDIVFHWLGGWYFLEKLNSKKMAWQCKFDDRFLIKDESKCSKRNSTNSYQMIRFEFTLSERVKWKCYFFYRFLLFLICCWILASVTQIVIAFIEIEKSWNATNFKCF